MNAIIVIVIFIFCFGLLVGYAWGNSRRGKLTTYTNELPDGFFKVVSIDKVSAVLEAVNFDRKRFLVSTKVFGGKPIRPKDTVRKIKSDNERKELGIPVLGFPPLVKENI